MLDASGGFKVLLGKVFDHEHRGLSEKIGEAEYQARRFDFIFHMTDRTQNLAEFNALAADPDSLSLRDARLLIGGFLIHVIPHLNAAGRLLLDEVPDAFAELYRPAVKVEG